MTIAGKDRRGLTEIVALASLAIALGGVVVVQLLITHRASTELLVVLAAVGGALPIRGMQSANERSASSEQRNFESNEMRQATADMRGVTSEMRRELDELRRGNEMNRMLQLAAAAQQPKDKG